MDIREKIKNIMEKINFHNIKDYAIVEFGDGESIVLNDTMLDMFIKTYEIAKANNCNAYCTRIRLGKKAKTAIFSVIDGIVRLGEIEIPEDDTIASVKKEKAIHLTTYDVGDYVFLNGAEGILVGKIENLRLTVEKDKTDIVYGIEMNIKPPFTNQYEPFLLDCVEEYTNKNRHVIYGDLKTAIKETGKGLDLKSFSCTFCKNCSNCCEKTIAQMKKCAEEK